MPGSVRENDQYVREFVLDSGVRTALDVGAGEGTYARVLDGLLDRIEAVEVWRPYVNRYKLDKQYDEVTVGNIVDLAAAGFSGDWDLVVLGDVLEHMDEADALDVWDWAAKNARWGLISVPIVHYPQGAVGGNPWEEHRQEHLTVAGVLDTYGPFDSWQAWDVTGTFIKRFA